jgi:hypothetical protein
VERIKCGKSLTPSECCLARPWRRTGSRTSGVSNEGRGRGSVPDLSKAPLICAARSVCGVFPGQDDAHRLLCGICTEVPRLLPAGLVVKICETDPTRRRIPMLHTCGEFCTDHSHGNAGPQPGAGQDERRSACAGGHHLGHRSITGPGAEPVQGLLAGLNRTRRPEAQLARRMP